MWKTVCGVFDFLGVAAVSRPSGGYFLVSTLRHLPSLQSVSSIHHLPSLMNSTNTPQIIDDTILCVHGGLSPDIKTIDQIRLLARVQEIPHEGAFCG